VASGNVIQGYFPAGVPHAAAHTAAAIQRHAAPHAQHPRTPQPPQLPVAGGQPLPPHVLQKMESFFRTSFTDVRVHVGPHAAALGALAVTQGAHIHFAPGHYEPDSPRGQQILGHELAHVVQQRTGRVRSALPGAIVRDAVLDREATLSAVRAVAHRPVVQRLAAVVQAVTVKAGNPPGARGKVSFYKLNGKERATDGKTHWYRNQHNTWTRIAGKKKKGGTYGRFKHVPDGRGAPRAASFAVRKGSGASYFEKRRRRADVLRAAEAYVASAKSDRRKHRQSMKAATADEGVIETTSATQYAAAFGAPVIAGGYNWCHLIGHGGGGSDDPDNIVAASTHNNSEQLAIELIVYQYAKKGVKMRVEAERYSDSLYLAKKLAYYVLVGNDVVYSREMNALRTTAPSIIELTVIKYALTHAITQALE
jgi:hypothetical protein